MGQDTGTDDGTNGKALGPHTGLDDLLRRRLVFVRHDDRGRDAHAERPATEDDLVLVLVRPLLELASGGEGLPALLLDSLDTLELLGTDTGPGGLVVLDTTALGLDGIRGEDDEDGGEGLELDGHGTECGPLLVGDVPAREGDGESSGETFDGTADGRLVVALELFWGSELLRNR